MKNDLTFKRTSLSTSKDVMETLEFKINSIIEQDLPVQESISDYIALSIDELDAQLLQLSQVKQEVAEREKTIRMQILDIKEEGAKFFEKFGVEKMVGNIISSITLTKPKDATTKRKFVTELTTKEKEQMIFDSGLGHYEDVEVASISPKLKINKRKVIIPELEDEA